MANVTHAQRTFSKLANIPTDSTLSLSCVDSSGQLMDCNYLSVTYAASTNVAAYCFVSPRVGAAANVTSLNITALTANGASGALGIILYSRSTQSERTDYLCLGSEKFSIIDFKTSGIGGVAAVTYGVVRPINNIRLSDNILYDNGS